MTSLDDKRIEWLYQHFQGITKRSDQFLVLFGVLFVSAVAILASSNDPIELPFLKVQAGRQTLLGSIILSAAFTLVAFFGNYDFGERALLELSTRLGCDYSDIWMVDTHPTIVDFARFRRQAIAAKRKLPARVSSAMVYPVLLLSALAWISAIWAHEVWLRSMAPLEAAPYILALPVLYVAWDRGLEYTSRRWKAWTSAEAVRRAEVAKEPAQIKLRPARTLSVSIAASAADVYAFIADPRRLPEWATGLGTKPTPLTDGAWRVETSAGPMRVVFAPANDFGVVDHVVFPLTGGDPVADVPLRVVPNSTASEVMLTVFQQPGMSDAQYDADCALVQADLERLKYALEHPRRI